jgi:hypothetical protein
VPLRAQARPVLFFEGSQLRSLVRDPMLVLDRPYGEAERRRDPAIVRESAPRYEREQPRSPHHATMPRAPFPRPLVHAFFTRA